MPKEKKSYSKPKGKGNSNSKPAKGNGTERGDSRNLQTIVEKSRSRNLERELTSEAKRKGHYHKETVSGPDKWEGRAGAAGGKLGPHGGKA